MVSSRSNNSLPKNGVPISHQQSPFTYGIPQRNQSWKPQLPSSSSSSAHSSSRSINSLPTQWNSNLSPAHYHPSQATTNQSPLLSTDRDLVETAIIAPSATGLWDRWGIIHFNIYIILQAGLPLGRRKYLASSHAKLDTNTATRNHTYKTADKTCFKPGYFWVLVSTELLHTPKEKLKKTLENSKLCFRDIVTWLCDSLAPSSSLLASDVPLTCSFLFRRIIERGWSTCYCSLARQYQLTADKNSWFYLLFLSSRTF